MLIIISGCDRVGKTTFCNHLQNNFPKAQYIHFSAPRNQEEAYNEYMNFINSIDNNKLYIIDRFYECESIYAPIYRNYRSLYNHQLDKLLRKNHKVLFIYIRAELNVIKQRINDIGDNFININDVEAIYYNYEGYMQSIQLPYIILNNNSLNNLNDNLNKCISLINNYDQFNDDYFGNLYGKKAVIFLNQIKNVHDYIVCIGPTTELKIKKNEQNKDIEGDYIIYKEKINNLVNYTDYFYTNNDQNVNLLNINERLYVS